MKTTKVTIGVSANCQDCQWKSEDYRKGEKEARSHARSFNHKIMMEVVKLVEIDCQKDFTKI